jgi:hypothetical protein
MLRHPNYSLDFSSHGYLGSYRIATAPEPNSRELTSFKSTYFDSPANNVGPYPAQLRQRLRELHASHVEWAIKP